MDLPRKHHYLPQFLLRGFASRTRGKEFYVWQFRNGTKEPMETNIINVGQERDFHGNPSASPLEFQVREVENRFGPAVNRWRSGNFSPEDSILASELAAHLIIRTKNLRGAIHSATELLFDQMQEALPKRSRIKARNQAKKALKKELKESGWNELIAILPPPKKKLAKQLLKSKLRKTDFRAATSELFNEFRRQVQTKEIIANAQIKALTTSLVPPERVHAMAELSWTLQRGPDHSWILGDVGVLGRTTGSREIISLANVEGEVLNVGLALRIRIP